MIAIIDAYNSGLLKRQNFMRNIFSGVIVGIVALPLAMAFAIASGATPEQGVYTAIVAALVVGLFGGSRIQIAGPLFFGITEKMERVLSVTQTLPAVFIFRLNDVPFMDMTGVEVFLTIIQKFHHEGTTVYICEANKRVEKKILAIGALVWMSDIHITLSLSGCYQKACQSKF